MRKAIIKVEFDCDGEWPSEELIQRSIQKWMPAGSVVLSEDVDGTKDFALLIESIETEILPEPTATEKKETIIWA